MNAIENKSYACLKCGEDYKYEDDAEDCCQMSEEQLRELFWESHPQFNRIDGREQNDYPTDTRCAFVDFVDDLERSGKISACRAFNVTLG